MNLATEKCFLTYADFHKIIVKNIKKSQGNQDFCDVTLVCEDNRQIKAHKIVLSSSSSLLMNMLQSTNHTHPMLYFWDVKERTLSKLVDFIYTGEVEIYESDLSDFLTLAKKLDVEGLDYTDQSYGSSYAQIIEPIIRESQKQTNWQDQLTTKMSVPIKQDEHLKEENYKLVDVDTDLWQNENTNTKSVKKTQEMQKNTHAFAQDAKQNKQMYGTYQGRSIIWNYFQRIENDPTDSYCKTCQKRVSRGKRGSTKKVLGNKGMLVHLKSCHQEQWIEMENSKRNIELMKDKINAREEMRRLDIEEEKDEGEFYKMQMESKYLSSEMKEKFDAREEKRRLEREEDEFYKMQIENCFNQGSDF